MLALFSIVLLAFSLTSQILLYKKALELEKPAAEITGRATGSVSLALIRYLPGENFTAELAPDNQSILLTWMNGSVDNYTVYASGSPDGPFAPVAAGIAGDNYTDTNAHLFSQRYYRLGVWKDGSESIVLQTAGKYDINLTTAHGRWNYVSLPLVPKNSSREAVLRTLKGSYDWVYEYNPYGGNYSYWFDPFGLGNLDSMHAGKCYIIQATGNTSVTFAGTDNTRITEQLITDNGRWNYLGWVNEITNRTNATASIAGDFDWIYEYVEQYGNYSYWFDPFGLGNIETFRPAECFIIQATANTTLSYTK